MAAPKAKKPSAKGTPPTPATPSPVVGNNTTKPEAGELVPLNFKTDPEFRKEFKSFAVMHDMSMVELLRASFAFYKQHKGG